MIEYMYSRMIATIASIALVAVVVSSSVGVIQQADRNCAENVACDISQLIEVAGRMQIQFFEQRIVIDEDGTHHDLTVLLNRTHVVVQNGGFECSKGFGVPVILMSAGRPSESLTATSGSILKIKAADDLFERLNEITIEVLSQSGLT
ncbi:MAG TPA: hypothetical protein VMW02_00290 [Thermoplasmata archaeon]|nr:hypothetical protein [Thermoplasmata archaeon]